MKSDNITKKDLLDFGKQINKRFDSIDKRFEQVDKRFDSIDKRFEQVDKRFEQVDKRFEQVDKRFEQVDKRFEQVDKRFDGIEKRMRVEILLAIKDAVHTLEEKIIKFKSLILTTVDPLLRELEDRREDREIGTEQMRKLREEIKDHEKRITKVEKVQSTS